MSSHAENPIASKMLFAPQELADNVELRDKDIPKGLLITPALMMVGESNILTNPLEPSSMERNLIIIGVGLGVSLIAAGTSRATIWALEKLKKEFNFLKHDDQSPKNL